MNFGSDNQSGVSMRILEALTSANTGIAHGYGHDAWTARANAALNEVFQAEVDAFFVSSGTAANSLALSCMASPWQTILCHTQAHITVDESTAPEFFTGGARIIPLGRGAGKLTAAHLAEYLSAAGQDVPHNPQPGAVSLAQSSENGLLYSPDELAAIANTAHAHSMLVHMDGARFANAVAALQCPPAELTWKAGIDVLSLGGTKNGCLAAEAVIFFNRELSASFEHRRKRSGHLLSKGRFLGAQFAAWLSDGHWLELARHANVQASKLSAALSNISKVQIVWPTQANEVFAVIPKPIADRLRSAGAQFYEWYRDALPDGVMIRQDQIFVRLVTSYATTDQEIEQFCQLASG